MHANIPIFVPHVGCPNLCSFCSQNTISGAQRGPTPQEAHDLVADALTRLDERFTDAEIAFFGGSFTAIPLDYRAALLEAVQPFLKEGGRVSGIRISTRPDAIDENILAMLRSYGVRAIELGAQSMYNKVLEMNRRGHDSAAVVSASRLIRQGGFELGLQMMTGLYGSTAEMDLSTGEMIADLQPDTVRIYPTVVIEGSYLDELLQRGEYVPMELDETVEVCARLLELFERRGIRVIRLGLHASDLLESRTTGGCYHPAIGELCRSRVYLHRISEQLAGRPAGCVDIEVDPRLISQLLGQRRCNISALAADGYNVRLIPTPGLGQDFRILNH